MGCMRRSRISGNPKSHGSGMLRSAFGSVRPYTRHEQRCPHRRKRDHNECSCSKWLYVHPRGEKPSRKSLTTPSWAEALAIATRVLEGFNPEIAAARAAEAQREKRQTSIEDASSMWLADVESRHGKNGTWRSAKTLTRKLTAWAIRQGILLIGEVTTPSLQAWSTAPDWTQYEDSSRREGWKKLRSFFSWLKKRKLLDEDPAAEIEPIRGSTDPVQGPYTAEQIEAIFASINASVTFGDAERRKLYADRLRAFMLLLLHSGCDVGDATLYEQGQITPTQVKRRTVQVFRYRRQKTGMLAVVPLPDDVVAALRSVPLLPDTAAGKPFRGGAAWRTDSQVWAMRVDAAIKAAGITHVTFSDASGRKKTVAANVKQLRHTFAVRQLEAGQRPEAVAKMMGHRGTQMIYRHYAPWVSSLDEAHIREVVSGWKSLG
jgi:integrase